MSKLTLLSYFEAFANALMGQLIEDQERWGDEWKKRPIEPDEKWHHQNVRVMDRILEYYNDWGSIEATPIPWLKVAGLAFIAWVREKYPDTYDD